LDDTELPSTQYGIFWEIEALVLLLGNILLMYLNIMLIALKLMDYFVEDIGLFSWNVS
jgi:hypothetical protein